MKMLLFSENEPPTKRFWDINVGRWKRAEKFRSSVAATPEITRHGFRHAAFWGFRIFLVPCLSGETGDTSRRMVRI